MRFTSALTLSAIAGYALAAPYNPFPLDDGFPSPSPEELAEIEQAAGGPLPNGPLPGSLTEDGAATLKLIATNEIFEVAFFTELLHNITTNVTGYDLGSYDAEYVTKAITAVVAQEQLHALGVNGILANAGEKTIEPCEYTFPVSTFEDAVALAATFTDIVLGVLPQAQTAFAADGGDESALVALFGVVIAQEGEQNGWYRSVQKKVPSAAPFLTLGAPQFAFTALQNFIVPGSCPQTLDGLTAFGALTVVSTPTDANGTLTFTVPGPASVDEHVLVYLTGANLPAVVPISNVTSQDGVTHFDAEFPGADVAHGLTIAAVVNGTADSSFASAAEVAAATIYGPGLIEVD